MFADFGRMGPKVGCPLLGSLNNMMTGTMATPLKITWRLNDRNRFFQHHRTFIQMGTRLNVADNSGAKLVMCIQPLNGKREAGLCDTIVASVKEAQPHGKVKKKDKVCCVVVRARMPRGRCDGREIRFDDNAVVLVNKKDKKGETATPIGTRVFGPMPIELREKHVKILTLAEHIV